MQSTAFSTDSSQIRNHPLSQFSSVTTATPAKRITFYKSGDIQFSGIRMAIHKRSFKCFDALLDDLSQKMPLPFGVRTITTPKGTHTIQSLEQLQDGACYLCSDRHVVKPINIEAARKRPVVWHHSFPLNTQRKPSRPDEPLKGHSSHYYHRQLKRIVLVKNNDPTVRKSIVLSRTARSLRAFMDEISELMQCNVRKLYTLEGQKIDSMQSLMQCPSVLVCVGREPFKPLLLENLRKNSEEKLPGIGTRSQSSFYSEGHDSKKNVNFGLDTRKSIIHPRSDSSNKSTRFSLSSEKSYPNGPGMTPRQLGCVTKEVIMNDDVEKRVLVNKDGSLSVEMKVRFHLVSDETLQWSTEIKKMSSSTNECSPVQEGDPHFLQGKVLYSEPESNTECEGEEDKICCLPKYNQMDFIESNCQNCYNQSQGYDIWKNPLHKDYGTSGTRSSSNSTGSSDKIIHQKTSVDSVYSMSRSSEEYTEQVVEKTSCLQQTIEEGDTRIEYCSIGHCCSQCEVSTSTTKCNIPNDTWESNPGKICHHNDNRTTNCTKLDNISKVKKASEPLISVTSNSSIIPSFKTEEHDDYEDLFPSVSRASKCCAEEDKQFACEHCYGYQNLHSFSRPQRCSADEITGKSMYAEVPQECHTDTDHTDSTRSSLSKVSSTSQCCQYREATTYLAESDMKSGLKRLQASDEPTQYKHYRKWMDGWKVPKSLSDDCKVFNESQVRANSQRTLIENSGAQKAWKEEIKNRNRSISAMSTYTCFSVKSTVCPCCGGCGRLTSTIPANSHGIEVHMDEEDSEVKSLVKESAKSAEPERSNTCTHCVPQRDSAISNILENTEPVQNNIAEGEVRHICFKSPLFDSSNQSAALKQSNKSNQQDGRLEDVDISAMSIISGGSAKTNNDIPDKPTICGQETAKEHLYMAQENLPEPVNIMQDSEMDTKGRVPSAMSSKTHSCKDSDNSHNLNKIQHTAFASPPVYTSGIIDRPHDKIHSERSTIALSKCAKVSVKSNTCLERDFESVLNPTDKSAGQETTKAKDDARCSSKNPSSMASPSPKQKKLVKASRTTKSPSMVVKNNLALSEKSGNSKASSKSSKSKKHYCSSSRGVERVANNPLGKSKLSNSHIAVPHGRQGEPLSPTSTASVSLGLSVEERSVNLNECSDSNTSQIFDEPRYLSVKYTSEPSALDYAINNSAITEIKEEVKTAGSTSSSASDKSELSNFMQDSDIPEVILGAESEGIMSTKSKTECKFEIQLLQNDGDHRVPTILSDFSETSQQNAPSKSTSTIKVDTHSTQAITINTETNKDLPLSKEMHLSLLTAQGTATDNDQSTAKSNKSSLLNLELTEARRSDNNSANNTANVISFKTLKSDKNSPARHKYVIKSEVSQSCTTLNSKGDSVLLHSPDLLKEKDTDTKSDIKGSRSNISGKSNVLEEMQINYSNSKENNFKQSKISTGSQNKPDDHCKEPLMPSCLPNASLTDVVNDWLKNIPIDSPMYEEENEFSEKHDETLLQIHAVKRGCLQNEIRKQSEKPIKIKESQEIGTPGGADPFTEDKSASCDAKLACIETFQTTAANSGCSHLSPKLTKRKSLTNNYQSSIQVIKVFLSPKLDRCNSLPEVSPTYGKKLSTSVKGLLECLANLQIIDPDPKIYDKYSEIISTLQSLWNNKPSETVQEKQKIKVIKSYEDDFNMRSSSGVDLSSGSTESGGGVEKSETAQDRTLLAEQKAFLQIQGDAIKGSRCDSLSAAPEQINTALVSSIPVTPDIVERVQCSPKHAKLNEETQKVEGLKVTDDILQTTEHIKYIKEIASTFSMRISANNRNIKTYPTENNKSSAPDQKGQLTKRISQDPDPVWVLSLLKKLEKQFMSHYANVIAEFKVRWDLNDNETLDIMISELKEEVHKRIQATINRELQKIQSRAGRTPRPPINTLSRDSTIQTEQRRRRFKVMQNKNIHPSRSEDINTASGTEFSDQRSDDEYCPCDTCVKKKTAFRVDQCTEALRAAPVLKDFDLQKILQTKKDLLVNIPVQCKLDEQKEQIQDSTIIVHDERDEKVVPEWETNKDSETRIAEEEESDKFEEYSSVQEKWKEPEHRTGEGTQ